jgi:hypothetical protein
MTGAQAKLAYLLVMMAGCLRPQICMKEKIIYMEQKNCYASTGLHD